MIQGLRQRLGKGLTALAVVLVAVLVVQAPVAIVDHALHAGGHGHAANPFAGALEMDGVDHDHHPHHDDDHQAGGDHHDDEAASTDQASSDDDSRDPASPQNAHHHHHHDGPSVFGLTAALTFAGSWATTAQPAPPDGPPLASAGSTPQERPPKVLLEHVA